MVTLVIASYALAGFFSPSTALADIPLKAPAGWKSSLNQGATVLTPSDVPEGKVYAVIVTSLQGKAGSLDDVYEIGKKMIAQVGAYSPATEPKQARSEGGWDYKLTIGTVTKDKNGFLAEVIAVKKDDAGGVVIVLSDSVETLQRYTDPFAQMLRSLGGSAKPPPAPAIANSSGVVDLQYAVPSGWVESKKAGATVLENSKDEFYDKWRWTLVIMPSQPLRGSLRENFQEYWKALISANYESPVAPLPLMARLRNGYVCAFDADSGAKNKANGAKPRIVSVYLIAHGDRFVPVLAILYGYDQQLDQDLDRFIETATIPSSSDAKIPLFSKSEIVGDWNEGSASIASYVTSSGDYAGDASIYTASSFHFRADGTYKYNFVGLRGSLHIKENHEGSWKVEDDTIVLSDKEGRSTYSMLGYGVDPKAGRFLVLGNASGVKAKVSFSNPRGPFQATWYKSN